MEAVRLPELQTKAQTRKFIQECSTVKKNVFLQYVILEISPEGLVQSGKCTRTAESQHLF
jgi:hypothetical protein